MADDATHRTESIETGAGFAVRMAGFVLWRAFDLFVGREGGRENIRLPAGGYCRVHRCKFCCFHSFGDDVRAIAGDVSLFVWCLFCLFFQQAQVRVLAQREEQALLKAYIIEWRKFFTQSNYLPLPFRQLETIHVQVGRMRHPLLTF